MTRMASSSALSSQGQHTPTGEQNIAVWELVPEDCKQSPVTHEAHGAGRLEEDPRFAGGLWRKDAASRTNFDAFLAEWGHRGANERDPGPFSLAPEARERVPLTQAAADAR